MSYRLASHLVFDVVAGSLWLFVNAALLIALFALDHSLSGILLGVNAFCLICGLISLRWGVRAVEATVRVSWLAWVAVGLFLFQLSLSVVLPDFGWDALDWWLQEAAGLVRCLGTPIECSAYENRHPPVLPILYAADIIVIKQWVADDVHAMMFNPRVILYLAWVGYVIAIIEFARCFRIEPVFVGVALLVGLGQPLIENHFILKGYSEVYIGVFMSFSAVYLSRFLSTKSPFYLFAALAFALLPSCIRNTGFVYSTCAVAGFLFSLSNIRGRPVIAVAGTIIACAVITAFLGFDIRYDGFRISWMPDKSLLAIGGREIAFAIPTLSILLKNLMHAFFIKQSYSVMVLVAIISVSVLWLLGRGRAEKICADSLACFLSANILGIVVLLCFSQFFDHGMDHATPNRDTGNSRFHIPAFMLLPMLLLLALQRISSVEAGRRFPKV